MIFELISDVMNLARILIFSNRNLKIKNYFYSKDCCNYICRCGKTRTEPNAYENIIDHASDDENLLNM